MSDALSSGKGSGDENFPVASRLIAARHRGPILAFYAVARLADDIADHPTAAADDKLARLAAIEASLLGQDDGVPQAVRLRSILTERRLSMQHSLDLLEAFRRDVTKTRYADWGELMDYCRYSAAPVGRFVLDVHGQPQDLWGASDALCAALQVINHLQDCGKDARTLNRVYVPCDALAAAGCEVGDLWGERASPQLRGVIAGLARRSQSLLATAAPLAGRVGDFRLRLEIAVIRRLAISLAARLTRRDPLSQRVHHRRIEAMSLAVLAAISAGARGGARQTGDEAP